MDDGAAIVELATLREICSAEMQCLRGFLSLNDVGIDDSVASSRIVRFNVFSNSHFGIVPVLRLATGDEDGQGLCLSQVVVSPRCPPVMGETAIVSPMSDVLLQNEERIVRTAFLAAKAALAD
ncbi:MAG: hypothetical protein NXH78_12680 [Hyphomonadaceae bacterium]|nr:hypothetical protein [Hyphomonadaceae bacterium]